MLAAVALMAKAGFLAGTPAKVIFLILAVLIQAVLPLLGHAAVLRVLKWLSIPFVVLFVVMAILTTSKVNLHVPAHGAGWGSLFVFLALVISAGGLGWTENGNDYSRYLPPDAEPQRIVLAVALGGAIPSALLEILGAAVATGVPAATTITGLTASLPSWFVWPFLIFAIFQLFAINTIDLYSSGVTLQSLIPRLHRLHCVADRHRRLRRVRRLRGLLVQVLLAAGRLPAVHHRLAGPLVRDLPGRLLAAAQPLRQRGAAGRAGRPLLPQRRGVLARDHRPGGRHGRRRAVAERLLAVRFAAVQPGRRVGLQRVHGPVLRRHHLLAAGPQVGQGRGRGDSRHGGVAAPVNLTSLNAIPGELARQQLLACCSSARWAAEVASGRPYASADELLASSDAAVAGLAPADLEQALAGHPRIGERRGADDRSRPRAGRGSRPRTRPRSRPWPTATRRTSGGSATSTWSARPAATPADLLALLRRAARQRPRHGVGRGPPRAGEDQPDQAGQAAGRSSDAAQRSVTAHHARARHRARRASGRRAGPAGARVRRRPGRDRPGQHRRRRAGR